MVDLEPGMEESGWISAGKPAIPTVKASSIWPRGGGVTCAGSDSRGVVGRRAVR